MCKSRYNNAATGTIGLKRQTNGIQNHVKESREILYFYINNNEKVESHSTQDTPNLIFNSNPTSLIS